MIHDLFWHYSFISMEMKIMFKLIPILLVVWFLSSCKTPGTVFSKKNAHEEYADKLTSSGLGSTALGIKWFDAGNKALGNAVAVQLPYQESGYFAAERPGASGLSFSAKRGEQLIIELQKTPATNYLLFCDLFQYVNGTSKYMQSLDTLTNRVQYNV